MLLKVGELARHTGLTVRTLHHYDEIGLLKPSGRSGSGYRLYSQADVQRLHGIQSLRHLGLALSDIAGVLDGEVTSLVQRDIPLELTHGIDLVLFLAAFVGHKYLCMSAGSWS